MTCTIDMKHLRAMELDELDPVIFKTKYACITHCSNDLQTHCLTLLSKNDHKVVSSNLQ